MICTFFLPPILLMVSFTLQKLKFDIVLITFAFVAFAFGVKSKKVTAKIDFKALTTYIFFWEFYSFSLFVHIFSTFGVHYYVW